MGSYDGEVAVDAALIEIMKGIEARCSCAYECTFVQERAACPCSGCVDYRTQVNVIVRKARGLEHMHTVCMVPPPGFPESIANLMLPGFWASVRRTMLPRPLHQVPLFTFRSEATVSAFGVSSTKTWVHLTRFAHCTCAWCSAVKATGMVEWPVPAT